MFLGKFVVENLDQTTKCELTWQSFSDKFQRSKFPFLLERVYDMAVKSKTLKIEAGNKYPLIPLDMIEIPERPEDGCSKLFFNPRSLSSFDIEDMTKLRESIRQDGLQQPPIVRVFTDNGDKSGKIVRVELVAGERRYRSIAYLIDEDIACYDEESGEMVSAKKLYERIPCKVLYNITDEQALRIAFKENEEHKSLTIQEEITLVERLTDMGMKQDEISILLDTNVTWVSQTSNFRAELPEEAFNRLINGQIARHVAVQILSYNPEDREVLFQNAIATEEEEFKKAWEEVQSELEMAEDSGDIADAEQEAAMIEGDIIASKSAKKKVASSKKKVEVAKSKQKKLLDNKGAIKQGHIAEGSRKANVMPKKGKILGKPAISEFYINTAQSWIEQEKTDKITGLVYPPEYLELVKHVSDGIIQGKTDLGEILRNYLIDTGTWEPIK